MVGSRRRDMGLGAYPAVTLAQAREKARDARARIERGEDPILARERVQSALKAEQARIVTVEAAAAKFIASKQAEWKNAKHGLQWHATLAQYVFPVIGGLHVGDVTQAHVLRILEPIWTTKTETASRVRGRVENILDWATARGHRTGDNPARWKGHLDKLLPTPSKVKRVEHHPAVPVDEAPSFYTALTAAQGIAARALRFAMLTAARSGEVRGATWSEIDLSAGMWVVPAERMKANAEHRVPLSSSARALLQSMPRIEGCNLIFPGTGNRMLSDMSLSAVMRRMGSSYVPHGLRSTFRDWVAERTNYPRELAEMALAHTIGDKVEAAYRRGDMVERRAAMMVAWAVFLEPEKLEA
jgi:integrase